LLSRYDFGFSIGEETMIVLTDRRYDRHGEITKETILCVDEDLVSEISENDYGAFVIMNNGNKYNVKETVEKIVEKIDRVKRGWASNE
jgi:uncharacterized protein YlzI (FlbEa/FlbD family)